MISEAKTAAKYLNNEDEGNNVRCLEIFLCPCFSTIAIFVGMHVVVVVAGLPSCWLVVISQLKSHFQSKIEHVLLLHLKHHW